MPDAASKTGNIATFFIWFMLLSWLEHETDHDRDDQRVDADCFGEREAQDHVRLDHWLRLRIAAQGVHRPSGQVSDGEGWAESTKTHGHAGADVLHALVADREAGVALGLRDVMRRVDGRQHHRKNEIHLKPCLL